MDVVLFSENNEVKKSFSIAGKSRRLSIIFRSFTDIQASLRSLRGTVFVYIDISNLDHSLFDNILGYLSRQKKYGFGIIDPRGEVKDPSMLFYKGASDYIGRKLLKEGMTKERMQKALRFPYQPASLKTKPVKSPPAEHYTPSGKDWKKVRAGWEYTFCLMYIELDDQNILREKFGDNQLKCIMSSFEKVVRKTVSEAEGRIWIWNEFGGLILFPFDGNSCRVCVTCLRLILSRNIISVEELKVNTLISYHIVLHIGNTVYRGKGETGTIISGSINSIYHIGKKYAKPGNMYITSEVFKYLPPGLKRCFISNGNFEELDIFKLKIPQYAYQLQES